MTRPDLLHGTNLEGLTFEQLVEQLPSADQEAARRLGQSAPEAEVRRALIDELRRDQAVVDAAQADRVRSEIFDADDLPEIVDQGTVTMPSGGLAGSFFAAFGYASLKVGEFVGDKIVHGPQRVLSGIFTSLENWGSKQIKAHAPWVEKIPWIGSWFVKAATKSLGEREKEAAEKKKKESHKKEKEDKAKERLEKDIQAAGNSPKEIVKAFSKYKKATTEEEEGGSEKKAAPKESAKAEEKKS